MPVRILLADDHAILRSGLRRILESYPGFVVAAEAASGTEAVTLARDERPDVAIVDVGMPGLNGIEATAQILRRSPSTAVLILSMHSDERYVVRALKAGARGYLLKDSVERELIQAIEAVHAGKTFFSPAVAKVLSGRDAEAPRSHQVEDRYDLLTEREREIYQLLAEGKCNKEIASLLCLSLHTVETHRTRVMDKLGLHSAAELVLSAVRRGLVGLP
ncbi:MAG: response regulator transcription factor [Bryobacteraceae bacterium]|jgi:DNA-binding NarL/FixJ family response regulator